MSQERWEGPLSVETRYHVWARPSAGEPKDGERERACAAYRPSIDNSFVINHETVIFPDAAALLFDRILKGVETGTQAVTCRRFAKRGFVPCDAKAVLRDKTLGDLYIATLKSEVPIPGGKRRTYDLYITTPQPKSGFTVLMLTVASDQIDGKHIGLDNDITSVQLDWDIHAH